MIELSSVCVLLPAPPLNFNVVEDMFRQVLLCQESVREHWNLGEGVVTHHFSLGPCVAAHLMPCHQNFSNPYALEVLLQRAVAVFGRLLTWSFHTGWAQWFPDYSSWPWTPFSSKSIYIIPGQLHSQWMSFRFMTSPFGSSFVLDLFHLYSLISASLCNRSQEPSLSSH